MKKNLYLFICIFLVNHLHAQFGQRLFPLNNYKIIIGAGTSIYWGPGRLQSLPKTNSPNELSAAFTIGFFKTLSDKLEIGIRYNHADLKGQRFGRTWGYTTFFNTTLDDLNIQTNFSLNNNLYLREEFYTINLIAGFGAANYSATLAYVEPYLIKSSIGVGRTGMNNLPEKQTALYGTIGLGYHVRLNNLLSIGIDNLLNITNTKNITGLLDTQSTKMYDSYTVHVLTIGLRLGKGNKLFCNRL
ncbi:MAG: hypothetical protein K9G64_06565 [Bacteroidia bacterium]|nr:hypothetical protein [Bacteroidia bacterium]